jgi:CDP-diacylglycerol pyrophosphatase
MTLDRRVPIHTVLGALASVFVMLACHAANRDALRQIVQDQCAVHWLEQHSALPCERIYLPDAAHARQGFAVLADRKGGAHFLLIPTRSIAGIESPDLLEAGTPNYFAAAWSARDLLGAVARLRIPRDAVGLAVNPRQARSQDQFHIHIECLRADVAAALRAAAPQIKDSWTSVAVGEWRYDARRVMGDELGGSDPIALLAELPGARSAMGEYTLVVAGITFSDGPGFVLLAGKRPAGELLLDSTCAVAAPT